MRLDQNCRMGRGMGEARGIPQFHHYKVDSVGEAQKIADAISEEFEIARWNVEYSGRKTKRRRATAWRHRRRILVHVSGQNLHTIAHEVCHEWGRHHDHVFKSHQRTVFFWIKENIEILCGLKYAPNKMPDGAHMDDHYFPPRVEPVEDVDGAVKELIQELIEDAKADGNSLSISEIRLAIYNSTKTFRLSSEDQILAALKNAGVVVK